MPNFDINSKFNKDANFSQVVFGEDGYLLETELNEMQHIQDEARASLIRESIPSGVLNHFDPTITLEPNTIKLSQETKVNVYGQILTIPKNTTITLSEPPTKDFKSVTGRVGHRDDLVFLEAWKEEVTHQDTIKKYGGENESAVSNNIKDTRVGVETTRRIQWKWRIRVIDDVDFNKYPKDGFTTNVSNETDRNNFLPQGGNSVAPTIAEVSTSEAYSLCYVWSALCTSPSKKEWLEKVGFNTDNGLIVGGTGDASCKSKLKTADGYCYAIPLFRVKRRNSGEYSITNSNGAIKSIILKPASNVSWSSKVTFKLANTSVYDSVQVGQVYRYSWDTKRIGKVVSKEANNTIVFEPNWSPAGSFTTSECLVLDSGTPLRDCDNSDIILMDDIIDLRHKVSLTGFNYKELMEYNFAKLLRGELKTKSGQSMLKTYHGLNKTPIDSNTLFYMSGDMPNPELGESPLNTALDQLKQVPSPTGLALNLKQLRKKVALSQQIVDDFTIEFFIKNDRIFEDKTVSLLSLKDGTQGRGFLEFWVDNLGKVSIEGYNSTTTGARFDGEIKVDTRHQFTHIRVCGTRGKKIDMYCNGVKMYSFDFKADYQYPNTLIFGSYNGSSYYCNDVYICDFSVSNINRGDVFQTLPQDFINGYAVVSNKFNQQRRVLSDSFSNQISKEKIKCTGNDKKHIEVTKAGTNWANGDKIKIKALSGGAISGLIDTDTAFSRIVDVDETEKIITLDSIKGLSDGDCVNFVDESGTTVTTTVWYLKIHNSSKNQVYRTTSSSTSDKLAVYKSYIGHKLIEATTSSSSPIVKFMNSSTLTTVSGTWTGLGTKEATFTLGTNSGLTNQDIEVQYTLSTGKGDGAFGEVINTIHGAEHNGVKLEVKSYVSVFDDLKGKVAESTKECPHGLAYTTTTNNLISNPTSLSDTKTQSYYNSISKLDGSCDWYGTVANEPNLYAQQIFRFDIIRCIEDKYGEIPSVDKIAWAKENIHEIRFDAYGYGTCQPKTTEDTYTNAPDGYKYRVAGFSFETNSWKQAGWNQHTTSKTPANVYINYLATNSNAWARPDKYISPTGMVYFCAHSNESTAEVRGQIFTDYVSIEIKLKQETNYEILAPVDTRRDAGKSVAYLVLKDTRELVRYPLGDFKDTDTVVTYGTYSTYQGVGSTSNKPVIKYAPDNGLVTKSSTATLYAYSSVIKPIVANLPLYKPNFLFRSYDDSIVKLASATPTTYADKNSNMAVTRILSSYRNRLPYTVNSTVNLGNASLFRGLTLTSSTHSIYDSITFEPLLSYEGNACILIYPMLVNIDGELCLMVACSHNSGTRLDLVTDKIVSIDIFKLEGSPLVKEVK